MARGFFISFEGGEGTGKSTQAHLLAARLEAAGRSVLLTREPGGAPGAELIREILTHGPPERWSPLAETFLFAAAREEHLRAAIRPALRAGTLVVCDRFADSTRAYQGAAGGVPEALIGAIEAAVVGADRPDLTFILDLDPDAGLARAGTRGGAGRFEAKGLAFHRRLRAAYLEIARANPARCLVVDAARAKAEIAEEIAAVALARIAASRQRAKADG